MRGFQRHLLGAGLALTALVACGGDSSGPSQSKSLDQTQAGIIGQEAASQVGALAAGITTFGFSGSGPGGGLFLRSEPAGRLLSSAVEGAHPALRRAMDAFTLQPGDCTPSVSDPTDTDADGVPDHAIYTFNCVFVDDSGNGATVTGTVTVTDPAGSLFGYTVDFDHFVLATTFVTPQGIHDLEFQFDGTTGVDVQTGQASATEDITWRTRLDGDRILLVSNTWSVGFTPSAGPIDPASGIAPAGSFTVNGLFSWVGNYQGAGGSWGFGIQTTAPLVYDGLCTDDQWPFESGSLRGLISANQNVGFTVDFQGCGVEPVVDVFGAST